MLCAQCFGIVLRSLDTAIDVILAQVIYFVPPIDVAWGRVCFRSMLSKARQNVAQSISNVGTVFNQTEFLIKF